MSGQRLAGLLALLLLAGAVLFVVFDEPSPATPGQPKYGGKRTLALLADVPQIAALKEFNVNDQNPFLPEDLRPAEIEIKHPKKAPPVIPAKPLPIPVQGPVIIAPKVDP